jgi:cell division protein FtsQ
MRAAANTLTPALSRKREREKVALAPLDVRAINVVAALVITAVLLALAWQAVKWATRSPVFTVRAIQLDAALDKASLSGVRAGALPKLEGNFFSIDLDAARAAFEQVPWVRKAVVRRVWPNRLAVTLEEHEAAAVWQDEGQASGRASDRLVNTHGEVFNVSRRDVAALELPTLAGSADAQSAQMLALWRRLEASLQSVQLDVETLHLSSRGSWRAELAGGGKLELGRGTDEELLARVDRLARTLASVNARFGGASRALVAADLRHRDGYALRLAGITTAAANAQQKP